MIIKNKYHFLLLLITISVNNAYCQSPDNLKEDLVRKFYTFCTSVPREEIYVMSDRKEYIAGEWIWFSLYLVDRQSMSLSNSSRIAYIELLDAQNKPVAQKKILMNDGLGSGQFVIPDTSSSGFYLIRAYTNRMKNFAPGNFYTGIIKVYNTLRSASIDELSERFSRYSPVTNAGLFINPSNTGVIKDVNNSGADSLKIFLNFDESAFPINNSFCCILIQTHGNINYINTLRITGKELVVAIPKSSLSRGISQVTVFNSSGKPVGERYIYTRQPKNKLAVINVPDTIGLREKITVGLEWDGLVNDETGLSISVTPETDDLELCRIDDYLIFGTEYDGLQTALFKDGKIDEIPAGKIDSILLGIRSNWIDWDEIVNEKLPDLKYQPEKEKHILTGKLPGIDSVSPVKLNLLFLCYPGKIPEFQYSRPDREGNFTFEINIDSRVRDLVIIPEQDVYAGKAIPESPFSYKYSAWAIPNEGKKIEIPSYIPKWGLNYQVARTYGSFASFYYPDSGVIADNSVRFYGKPDFELIMDNYIKLPEMQEVIFELLPQVSVRKKGSQSEIIIADRVNNEIITRKPDLFIDGVMIKDPSLILNINPESVEKIDVIRGKYMVGRYIFNGIINVITKSGNFADSDIPGYMSRFTYRVLDQQWLFGSPDYSTEEKKGDRIPDYRTTLYWNPSVKNIKDGKTSVEFWSSDNPGNYQIIINGLSRDGNAISLRKIFHVK